MREIRVSRIEPKFIEYQWKKARPDPQSFDPNQSYRLIITYNLMYVPYYKQYSEVVKGLRIIFDGIIGYIHHSEGLIARLRIFISEARGVGHGMVSGQACQRRVNLQSIGNRPEN